MKAASEATSTDNPVTVTFDTLTAATELKKSGFEDRQADAVVTTISKAMSETVATKSDVKLLRADMELLRTDLKADMELHRAATKADMESLRADLKADMELHRADTKADMELLRGDLKLLEQSVDNRFDKVDLKFDSLEKSLRRELATFQDKIVIKLGALMVTMTFLLLAVGPFYFRWVNSLMSSL